MALGSSVAGMFGGAAGGNFVGGALVRLLLDAANFDAGLKTSEAKLYSFGRRMENVGRGMSRVGGALTRGVTLPIVAAGAASVKLAIDFEDAFTRIRAVSNASESDIRRWRGEVLKLSGQTAKSPQELAEALYFLASAGLKSGQVMQVLEMSAKASAAGLGETQDVARLTAQVLNAYAKSGMTAKQATDTLVAAIREGTAEPDEFADAMGRILPISSKAKVGFEEIAASLAALSNIGLDVNEGVTAMRGLLAAIVAPGSQAAATLKDIGISTGELRRVLADDGVIGALELLQERTGGNIGQLRKIIPNIRGLIGHLALTGDKAEETAVMFDRVSKSTGSLDKAFTKTRQGPGFQMKQMLAELQALAIEVGRDILPAVKDFAHGIRDVARWFNDLDPAMRKNIVKWLAFAAALGPVVKLVGGLVTIGGAATRVLANLGKAAGGAAAGAAGAGGAVAGGAGLVSLAAALAAGPAAPVLVPIAADQIKKLKDELVTIPKLIADNKQGMKDLFGIENAQGADLMAEATAELAKRLLENANAADQFGDILDELANKGKGIGPGIDPEWFKFEVLGDASAIAAKKIANLRKTLGFLGGELAPRAQELVDNAIQTGNWTTALTILEGSIKRFVDGMGGFTDSATIAEEATADLTNKVRFMRGEIASLKDKRIRISADMSFLAKRIQASQDLLASLPNQVVVKIKGQYVGGGAAKFESGHAAGFVARRPMLIGEGRYHTPFGMGAEALLPLNQKTLERIGEAIVKASRPAPAGGVNIHFNGPVYGFDDFDRKVSEAFTRNVMTKGPL